MLEIHRLLRSAAWRLGLNNFAFAFIWALAAALVSAMVLRVLQQTVIFDVSWPLVAIWGSAGVIASAVACAVYFRPNRKAVALTVDQGANLREALSTALYAVGSDDPWSRITVESASNAARRVVLKRAVPLSAPRTWPVPFALALAFTVLYIALPQVNIFKRSQTLAEEKTRSVEAVKVTTQVQEMKQKLDQMTQKLGLDKLDDPQDTNKPGPIDPDAIRRSAIKQLTKLSDQLEQMKQSEAALKLEATRQALQEIKPPGTETQDLAKAMNSGNFKQAKQELENLQNKMKSGQMGEQEREQVAEQMAKLAEQINKQAENKSELAKKLEQAGLDKNLANNPEALKKALEQAQNLSEKQKQDLQNQAQASEQAAESLAQMAEALNKMSQECKNSGSKPGDKAGNKPGDKQQGQEGQKGEGQKMDSSEQMSQQLDQMEQLSQEMQMAEAAMSECKSQMGEMGEGQGSCNKMGEGLSFSQTPGEWSAGEIRQSQGNGARGGPGQGNGQGMGEAAADFNLAKKKDNKNQTGKGPVVASRLVEGEAILNESTAAFESAVTVAAGEVSEEISGNVIPRDRHDAVKKYFGSLKKKADDAARKAAPAGSTTQPAAKTAKDAE